MEVHIFLLNYYEITEILSNRLTTSDILSGLHQKEKKKI